MTNRERTEEIEFYKRIKAELENLNEYLKNRDCIGKAKMVLDESVKRNEESIEEIGYILKILENTYVAY